MSMWDDELSTIAMAAMDKKPTIDQDDQDLFKWTSDNIQYFVIIFPRAKKKLAEHPGPEKPQKTIQVCLKSSKWMGEFSSCVWNWRGTHSKKVSHGFFSHSYSIHIPFGSPLYIYTCIYICIEIWDAVKISVDYFSKRVSSCVEKVHQTM